MISILIPARNEALSIGRTLQGVQKEFDVEGIPYEILVVNDGSTDDTEEVVRKIVKTRGEVRVVNNSAPHGIGNAIKKGLDDFKGDCVIIAMADGSDDPKNMIQYVREVRQGRDCCFGSRWGSGAMVTGYPRFKLALNRLANWMIQVFFQINYNDVTNAFKCYTRATIEGIKPILSHHFNITVELPLKAIVRGYSYSVIPTNWFGRTQGKSHLKIKEMGSRYLFIMLYVFLEKLLCQKDYRKK